MDCEKSIWGKNRIGDGNAGIEEPKKGVTKAEIDAAMQTVVENNVFNSTAATWWKPWKAAFAPSPGTWWLSNLRPATE